MKLSVSSLWMVSVLVLLPRQSMVVKVFEGIVFRQASGLLLCLCLVLFLY
ncbi:hypothetical protein HMPREF9370_1114 [Neisseria wadsworthii 9715]|uniref:Uncharacterized protein n=1 Tax=Neisseria wadsworthii 9715 TaxID=1030841 RepID=G4CPV4_9NEIS|nr:hypothetical protein HMPREF9370_1114 [Neisseria wadsworthii 9715]